jgi:hypothetical protein
MRSVICGLVTSVALLASVGCDSGGNNAGGKESGPPIQTNPKGPGAMSPPGSGGKAGVPESMNKPK